MTLNKIEALRTFAAAAEAGSLAGGGRALGRTRDQASKLLAALEADLDVALFERSTRSLVLTEAGAAYLDTVRRVLRDLDAADAAVRSGMAEVRGPLRVNAPMLFGMLRLAALIPEFLARYPEVALDVRLDDRLIEDPSALADVTLRIAATAPEDYATRVLCTVARHLCAAPTYLSRRGHPASPDAIREHACLHYGNLASGGEWVLDRAGEVRRIPIRGHLAANNGLVLREAALAGQGIAILPDFVCAAYLAAGQLEVVLPDWRVPDIHVFAMVPSVRQHAPKLQAFIDFLAERLHAPDGA
ncbi:LysR substrate-binding domain-containing protein [Methylobacterium sp. JK268]